MISVILPVKDEPELMSFLHDLHSALIELGEPYEILIQNEQGLGCALTAGMKQAKGDWILTMDADGQHDPRDIAKLWQYRTDWDLIIGGKPRVGDSRSLFKRLASKAYYHYVKPKGYDIKDLGSNFRLYAKWLIEDYLLKKGPRGFNFLQWALMQAAVLNAGMIEIPVSFNQRLAGKSKMSYRRELIERLRKT